MATPSGGLYLSVIERCWATTESTNSIIIQHDEDIMSLAEPFELIVRSKYHDVLALPPQDN